MKKRLLDQRGVTHLLIPIILILGVIGTVYLVTSGNPLKLFSKASNNPIVFKSVDGSALPVSNGIPQTSSPTVKVELTSPLGANTQIQTSGTVSYKIAENPDALNTAVVQQYTQHPTVFNYTFKSTTPGQKFLWVEFLDVTGRKERRSVQIEIADSSRSLSPSPSSETHITSCREITTPGNYVVDTNLQAPVGQSCLTIHDVNDVQLNCNAKTITNDGKSNAEGVLPVIKINNVNNFLVTGCTMQNINLPTGGWWGLPLKISNSSNGTIRDNTIQKHRVFVENSNHLFFLHNQFNSFYDQLLSSNVQIRDNTFIVNPNLMGNSPAIIGVIASSFGNNNSIVNNTINGGSDGVYRGLDNSIGADDGIVIDTETETTITGNTILNNWDCGIETNGFIQNTTISNNEIRNAGFCGIGGWHWNSWLNNTVSGNTITDAPMMLDFFRFRNSGLNRPNGSQDFVYFKDNNFTNNIFNPRTTSGAPASNINMNPLSVPSIPANKYILSKNRFANNNFSTTKTAPEFFPANMIMDGGGNTCSGQQNPSFPNPLNCTGIISTPTPSVKASPTSGSNLPCGDIGDVNGNGTITLDDVTLALRSMAGEATTLTPDQQRRTDVTGNGRVEINDLQNILLYILGRITTFPACSNK